MSTTMSNLLLYRFIRHLQIRPPCRCLCTKGSNEKPRVSRRVFSGIQPTGVPHIGNYLGAIQRWVQLQDEYDDIIFSVVDLHSITVPQDPTTLRNNILDMTACLLAAGINPEKSILFQQSTVPEHAELGWILGCLTTMPKLEHLPQWKEKSSAMKEGRLGLFTYPVLQSADILLYKATDVPVGDDQVKHIELSRHLAGRFNNSYGFLFPKPKALVGSYPRIKSLRDPTSKMSKSDPDSRSRIELTDSPDDVLAKLRKAVTDTTSAVTYDPAARPGVSNLIALRAALTGRPADEVVAAAAGLDTLQFKTEVAEEVIERLAPIQKEILRLQNEKGYLVQVLDSGRDRARDIAQKTITEVKRMVGLLL